MKKILLKILLVIACIVFWSWIFIQNIVPSGKFQTGTDFTRVNPWLPGLRPIERVVNRNVIIGDPIYADIKLPTRFDMLKLHIDYDNQTNGDFRVGIFTNKDKWQILFGDFKNNEVTFDLRGMPLDKNTVPVVFGAAKATSLTPLTIKNISVEATKAPITWRDFVAKPKYLVVIPALIIAALGGLVLVFLPITVTTFALLANVGSFVLAAALELWRPGFAANFVDSRIFILVFAASAIWYVVEHKKKN